MTPEEREQMILDNSKLVYSVVRKLYRSPYAYYDKEDMYQEGFLGLIAAVDGFDPDKGFAFSTYAVPQIHGRVMRFIRDNAQTMKYSRSDIDALARLNRFGKSIDELTPEDIEELELTQKNLAAIRSMNMTSINTPIREDSDAEIGDLIPYNTSEISDEVQVEMIENIKNLVIGRLSEKSQDVVDEWYYSMIIGMKPSQVYLGRKYDMSQAQVSRIIKRFKAAFAKKLEESGYTLPTYMEDDEE